MGASRTVIGRKPLARRRSRNSSRTGRPRYSSAWRPRATPRPRIRSSSASERSFSMRGMLAPRSEGLLAELRVKKGEEGAFGLRERALWKHRGPAVQVGVPRLAREHEPRPLPGLPRPRQADDLACQVQDLPSVPASVGEPGGPDEIEGDTELRVLVLGEDALAGRRLAPQEVGERAPVGAPVPEVHRERAQVEEQHRGKERRRDGTEARLRGERGERQRGERWKREAGGEKPPRDVKVRMEMTEDLDRKETSQGPGAQEAQLRPPPRDDDPGGDQQEIERTFAPERLAVVGCKRKKGEKPRQSIPGHRRGRDGRRTPCRLEDDRPPGQIGDELSRSEGRAPCEKPPRTAPPVLFGRERVFGEHRRRGDREDEGREIERVRGSQAGEPERGETSRGRPFQETIEQEKRQDEKEEAERVGAQLLRVADVERREGEQNRGDPAGGSAGAPGEKRSESRDRPDAPEDRRQLAGPIGRSECLDRAVDQIVEWRVDRVELESFPEERPVALDEERLEDLVQAVGEVIEPKDPDGDGREKENRRGEDSPARHHGSEDSPGQKLDLRALLETA